MRSGSLPGVTPGAVSLGALLLSALAVGCAPSPDRGTWDGTFDGSLSGVVRFHIDTRGTRLTGTFEGETRDGAPFTAEMEGRVRGDDFYATFEGTGRAALYRVPFSGFMTGQLGDGRAGGRWEAEIRGQSGELEGAWRAEQADRPADGD